MKYASVKFIIVLSLIIVSTTFCAKAQNADTASRNKKADHWHRFDVAGSFDFQVEYRKNNVDELNSYLTQQGFGALNNNNIWLNLAANKIYANKLVTMLAIGATPQASVTANDIKVSLWRGQIQIGAGYNLSSSTSYRLYPMVGVNFGDAKLKVKDMGNINNTNDFGEALFNQSASKTLHQHTFAIELGAGFDYVIKLKDKQMDCFTLQRNIPIGIRVGYYLPTYMSNWEVDDHELLNGPEKKVSSFFATLSIGLGYGVKK
jgi:hypothetical protein